MCEKTSKKIRHLSYFAKSGKKPLKSLAVCQTKIIMYALLKCFLRPPGHMIISQKKSGKTVVARVFSLGHLRRFCFYQRYAVINNTSPVTTKRNI
jgi:hypothetical protein